MLKSDLPFPCKRGKVRDVYDLGDVLLIVATDRISAYDVVMNDPIPGKGILLTAMSRFWFDLLSTLNIPHHLLGTEAQDLPSQVHPYADAIRGRFMLSRKARVVPIECVARGYLAGSAWNEYLTTRSICGLTLPAGLRQCQQLPTPPGPIFTPATKEDTGHDINVSFEHAAQLVGEDLLSHMQKLTFQIYAAGSAHALPRGIIIADTKFEFGQDATGKLILIDEVLTPDSSRFWPADSYAPGKDQPSFDKQFLRDYLLSVKDWGKTYPPPPLPPHVIQGTLKRYQEACLKLTGNLPG